MKKMSQPIYACFDITNRCNLECKHCIFKGEVKELTTEQVKEKLDWLDNNHFFSVQLAGGEPTVREDFEEIVRYAASKKFALSLATNGTLLTDEKITLLKECDFRLVQLSIDGNRPENDSLRGSGTFDLINDALDKLIDAEIPVGVATMITKKNKEHISELVSYLGKKKIKYLRLQKIIKNNILEDVDVVTFIKVYEQAKMYAKENNIDININLPCYISEEIMYSLCEEVFIDILPNGRTQSCFVEKNCYQKFIPIEEVTEIPNTYNGKYYVCSRVI